jgi:hypothetical protein
MLTILISFDIIRYVKIFFRIFKEPFFFQRSESTKIHCLNTDVHPLAIFSLGPYLVELSWIEHPHFWNWFSKRIVIIHAIILCFNCFIQWILQNYWLTIHPNWNLPRLFQILHLLWFSGFFRLRCATAARFEYQICIQVKRLYIGFINNRDI